MRSSRDHRTGRVLGSFQQAWKEGSRRSLIKLEQTKSEVLPGGMKRERIVGCEKENVGGSHLREQGVVLVDENQSCGKSKVFQNFSMKQK